MLKFKTNELSLLLIKLIITCKLRAIFGMQVQIGAASGIAANQ